MIVSSNRKLPNVICPIESVRVLTLWMNDETAFGMRTRPALPVRA